MGTSIDELLELLNGNTNKETSPQQNTYFTKGITRCSPASSGIYNSVVSDLHRYINNINPSSIVNTISLTIPDKELQWSDLEDKREHFLHNHKEIFCNSTDYFATLQDLAMDNIYLSSTLKDVWINKSIRQLYTYKNYICFEKIFRKVTGINSNRKMHDKLRVLLIKLCDNIRIRHIDQISKLKEYIFVKIGEESELNQYEVDEGIEQLSICFYKLFCFVILLESKEVKDIDFDLLPINDTEYDQNISDIRMRIASAPNEEMKLTLYGDLYANIKRKSNEFINRVCNDCYADFFKLVNQRHIQDRYLFKNSAKYRSVFLLYELIYDNVKFNLYRNYENMDSDFGLMRTNLIDRQLILCYLRELKSNIHYEFEFERRKPDHRNGTFVLRLANYDDFSDIIKLNNPPKPHRRMVYVKSSEAEIKIGIDNNSIWIIEEKLDDGTRNLACVTVLLRSIFEPESDRKYGEFSKDKFNDEYENEYHHKINKSFGYIDFNSVVVNNGKYGVNSVSFRGLGFQRLCLILAEELAMFYQCDYVCATVSAINKASMRNFKLNGYKKESTKIYRLNNEQSDYYDYITSDKTTEVEKSEYAAMCSKEVKFFNSYYENEVYNITEDIYLMDKDVPRDFVVFNLLDYQNESGNAQQNEEGIEVLKQEMESLRGQLLKIEDAIKLVDNDVNSVGDDVKGLTKHFEEFESYFISDIAPALLGFRNDVKGFKDKIPELFHKYYEQLEKSNEESQLIRKQLDKLDKGFAAITKQLNDHFSADVTGMREAEEEMQAVFGEIWNRLLPDCRTSLCSANLMWKRCEDLSDRDGFDFSGICILSTSALEGTIKAIFSDSFQQYMKKTQKKYKPQDWPRCLSYYNEGRWKASTRFMLGSFQYLIGAKTDSALDEEQQKRLSEMRKAYLNEIVAEKHRKGIEDATKLFTDEKYDGETFTNRLNDIAVNYRNKAAHTSKINYSIAEKCYHALIPKEYAAQKLNDINNLLIILYRLIDDDKMKKYLPNMDV